MYVCFMASTISLVLSGSQWHIYSWVYEYVPQVQSFLLCSCVHGSVHCPINALVTSCCGAAGAAAIQAQCFSLKEIQLLSWWDGMVSLWSSTSISIAWVQLSRFCSSLNVLYEKRGRGVSAPMFLPGFLLGFCLFMLSSGPYPVWRMVKLVLCP